LNRVSFYKNTAAEFGVDDCKPWPWFSQNRLRMSMSPADMANIPVTALNVILIPGAAAGLRA